MLRRYIIILAVISVPLGFFLTSRIPVAAPAPESVIAVKAPSEDWTSRAFAELAALEYHASVGEHGLQAPNRAQDLRTYFRADRIEVVPRSREASPWRFGWRTVRWGRSGDWSPAVYAAPVVDGSRVTYGGDGLSEWYENRADGLEQGFTVLRRAAGDGPLRIEAAVTASLHSRLDAAGDAVDFYTAGDVRVLRYAGLKVSDATGNALPANLEVSGVGGDRIAIVVNDHGARYPITVDPLLTSPDWTGVGDAAGDNYGFSVGTAGDVNGDGYSDVLVSAPLYDTGSIVAGAVFVYHGSAAGLSATPAWSRIGQQDAAQFGWSACTAGDVNGDGYDDVIIGEPGRDASGQNQGRVYVYHGSTGGLAASPAWTVEGEAPFVAFGWAVGTAGDVDGDGYDDVIVGSPTYTANEDEEGRAYVYHGSASGLAASPAWWIDGDEALAHLGYRAAAAGDVNADGYADVVVTAPDYDASGTDRGAAWVYHGSASGLAASAAWTVAGYDDYAELGHGVGAAGDLNGDGYADLAVGVPYYDGSMTDQGLVNIYAGTAAGLEGYPQWTFQGYSAGAYYGIAVGTAGDIDGDGYADLVVGASAGAVPGSAYVLRGTQYGPVIGGLVSTYEAGGEFGFAVATAGDVDGDGYSDLVVGARLSAESGGAAGAAYLYRGSAGGAQATPGWTTQLYQENAYYGWTVASAGDVNGDGFSDVVVGAISFDVDDDTEGAAFLYLGAAGGLSYTQAWMAAESEFEFATAVAGAGDVNGDGYGDVIVGSAVHDFGAGASGAAFVYLGSASGLSPTPDWIGDDGQLGSEYGYAVGSTGDVDGDGFADIVVGAPFHNAGAAQAGAVFVYHGGETGPATTPDWSAYGGQAGAYLGFAVAGAGDTNGDGFGDLIVAAANYNAGAGGEGKASVYLGSSAGLAADPDWTNVGDGVNAALGQSVAAAGDINGDGFSDIIVGAPGRDVGRGAAYVYRGSPTGPYDLPSWTEQGESGSARYGESVASAGDVDGDGYSDILVGAPNHDTSVLHGGRVYCYHGSQIGLRSSAELTLDGQTEDGELGRSVASAGDVNGDGFADILVGEPYYAGVYSDAGRALLHYGNDGPGRSVAPQQRRADDSAPIALGGMSDSPSSFLVAALGRSAGGRDAVRLEVEVKPLDVAFDGSGTLLAGAFDSGLGGAELSQLVTGLAPGAAYRWRLRVLADSPFFPRTPWFTPAGNAATEIDLRTGGAATAVAEPRPAATLVSFAAPYPNPFSGSTQLVFALPRAGRTRVAIYDVRGRRIKVLLDDALAAGDHPVVWDGHDDRGVRVANGIYFARVVQGGEVATRTLTVLR